MYQTNLELTMGNQILHFGPEMVNQAMPVPGIYIINLFLEGKLSTALKLIKK
jgi:hypothetical protein